MSQLTPVIEHYPTVYLLNDPFFSGADVFLRNLAAIATAKGFDIIISESNMLNHTIYEHVLIPELGIALITSNFVNNLTVDCSLPVNFMRFYDNK